MERLHFRFAAYSFSSFDWATLEPTSVDKISAASQFAQVRCLVRLTARSSSSL